MGEPRSFRNSPSSRVENQLKTIKLTARKFEKERVGMNERCYNSRPGAVLISFLILFSFSLSFSLTK